MSLPVPRIEDPWQYRKQVFICFGIIAALLGVLWICAGIHTGQAHPAHILRVLHDGKGPVPETTGGPSASSTPTALPEIKLFGKVVDETGAPIPDVKVRLTLSGSGSNPWQTLDRTTSADGRFSIHGHRAESLRIELEKSGYVSVPFPNDGSGTSGIEFPYLTKPALLTRHDTHAAPLIFTLWQPPRPLGTAHDRPLSKTRLDPLGVPYQIKIRDHAGTAFHTIEVRYVNSRTRPTPGSRNPYSWSATLTVPGVPGGALIEKAPAQVRPEAPATGYLPSIAIDFPATLPKADWRKEITRHYFLRFPDGSHGILTLHLDADHHELSGHIIWNTKPGDTNLSGHYLTR